MSLLMAVVRLLTTLTISCPDPGMKTYYMHLFVAQLFSQALPLIESVFSYDRVVRPRIRASIHIDGEESELYLGCGLPDPIEEVHRGQRSAYK